MYTLLVRCTFDAAHSIPGHAGPCAGLHGHSYRVVVEVTGSALDELGMVQDFMALRERIERALPDHRHLNEVMDTVPTAENIAAWIWRELAFEGLRASAVTVWETDEFGCRYEPPADAARQALPGG